jgi:hypothetical protein
MKSYLPAGFLILLLACQACSEDTPDCMCTEEFRMYFVVVTDSLGIPVDSLQTVITNDHGKNYDFGNYLPPPYLLGAYLVMTDGYQNDFSTTPGRILFSGNKESKEVTGEFYFNTDKCRCHIYKISGPDTLILK